MAETALISAAQLAAQLKDPALIVLDSTVLMTVPRFDGDYGAESGEARWRSAHIPGSVYADLLGELSDRAAPFHFAMPRPEVLAGALQRLGVGDGRRVVVYDSETGLWAARLWWMLRSIGLSAQVLDGGLRAWIDAGLPAVSTTSERRPAARLTIRTEPAAWCELSDVQRVQRGEAAGTLICALSRELFRGIAPTRYARRGRIPGSLNLPARELFDDRGHYLPTDVLANSFELSLGQAMRPLILYCGGGISAAATALALTLVGEQRICIYDGSLEEWTSDPSRPIATD